MGWYFERRRRRERGGGRNNNNNNNKIFRRGEVIPRKNSKIKGSSAKISGEKERGGGIRTKIDGCTKVWKWKRWEYRHVLSTRRKALNLP